MKDKIKELIKSGEHEELIIEALIACNNVRDHFNSVPMNGVFSGVADAWHCGEDLKQALTPKKKPVDMSVFVDSPIDCLFSDSPDVETESCRVGFLAAIKEELGMSRDRYFRKNGVSSLCCKPRMNYPFSYDLLENNDERIHGFIVNLQMSGFDVSHTTALIDHSQAFGAFRITGLQENRCWPWECER